MPQDNDPLDSRTVLNKVRKPKKKERKKIQWSSQIIPLELLWLTHAGTKGDVAIGIDDFQTLDDRAVNPDTRTQHQLEEEEEEEDRLHVFKIPVER